MAIDRVKVRANAEKLLRANRIPEAVRELQKLAEDNPHDIQVLNQIGNLYLRLGNKDAAVPMFIKVAELFAKSGFATKAVASLKIVTREQPENLSAWQMLASLSEQQGFTREALSAYEKVAQIVGGAGNVEALIATYRKLLDLEPNNIKVRVQLGDSLVKAGKKDEGIKQYVKAGGQLTAQGLVKEAARMYERAIQLDPNNVATLEGVVKAHVAQHQEDLALQILDNLLERSPSAEILLLLKGEVFAESKRYDEAQEMFRRMVAARSGAGPALPRLVRLLVAQKKIGDAVAVLDHWLPSADAARMQEFEALYEEIARFAPENLACLKGLCATFRKGGMTHRLITALTGVVDAALHQDNPLEARDALRELVKLEPSTARFADQLREIEARLGSSAPVPAVPLPSFEPPKPKAPAPAPPPPPLDIEVELDETGESEIEVAVEDLNLPAAEVTSSFSRQAPAAHGPAPPSAPEPLPEALPEEEEAAPPAASHPLDAREAEIIREQLTEAEVFLKYGLTEKAVAELQAILKKVPDHIHAHQKLIAIFKSQRKDDKLVRQILKLAAVFQEQGDAETFEALVEEARAIDPNHRALLVLEQRAAVPEPKASPGLAGLRELDLGVLTPVFAAPPPVRPAPRKEPEIEISLEEEPEPAGESPGFPSLEKEPELVAIEKPAPAKQTEPEPARLQVEITPEEAALQNTLEEQLEEAEFYLSQELFGEAQRALQLMEKRWPAEGKVSAFRRKLFAAVGGTAAASGEEPSAGKPVEMESEGFEVSFQGREETGSQPLEWGVDEESTGPQPTLEEVPAQSAAGGDLVLEEETQDQAPRPEVEPPAGEEALPELAEPAMAQEAETAEEEPLQEESPAVFEESLQDALTTSLTAPPKARTKLKVSAQDLLAEEAAPAKDDYYDLAKELGAALDGLQVPEESLFEEEGRSPEEMSFEEVFEEFKKGVEKKVGEEDFGTHYNLGIAYKEMELLDEAIGEFQLAARSPQFFVECCSMLGLCFRQKGMAELAEKWYRKGIAAPGFSEEIYVGLKYDLAEALLEQGNRAEAAELFKEVYAANANYRDIKERVKQVK
jgi:pilus assembly protein FimV